MSLVQLIEDLVTLPTSGQSGQWGIFGGAGALIPDSVVTFSYKNDWTVATYPIEAGGFQNYDKVSNPFELRIMVAVEGPAAAHQAFLGALDAAAQSLALLDVITPDAIYLDVTIDHVDYDRAAARSNGLLQVEIGFMEIRESVMTSFQNTQSPSGASPVPDGQVQTTNPTPNMSNDLPNVQ